MSLFGFLSPAWDDQATARLLAYATPQDPAQFTAQFMAVGVERTAACSGPHGHKLDDTLLALQGGPIWQHSPDGSARAATPAMLLEAYRDQGAAFIDRLTGRFAIALLDPKRRLAMLAIDPMGIERMAYCVRDGALVFGSSAERVARAPSVGVRLNRQALFDYLLQHIVASPATVYQDVRKLRAGTAAIFEAGTLRIHRYWQPAFNEQPVGFDTLKTELQAGLRAGVEMCSPDERTGAFLSGGLDSSSVAGMLARVQGRGARTFSMGFGVDAYDELAYARIANRHFNSQGHEYHVTADDIVTAFPLIARAYDEPFGNSSAVPTYICAKFAREHGVEHLLAGDGGDEIFGGNERYVRQGIFERYFAIPAWLRKGLIEPLARTTSAEGPIMPLRKLRSYVDQANVRLPARFETWNFMYREGTQQVIDPEFLRSVDVHGPLTAMREVFDELPDISLLNRMLFYDWHYTLADNDLRKVNAMCELAGVRVSYPMLDRRVVDLSLRVPSAVKIAGNELRSFYKRAMADFLPGEILTKQKHGFGLPFGVWLKTHAKLRELILGHLESLRTRCIVRSDFIDSLIARHGDGDASFYGYPIWDMAMLDAWLTAHDLST